MSLPKIDDHQTQDDFWKKNWKKFKEYMPYKGYKKTLTGMLAAGGGTVYYFWAHIYAALDYLMAHNYQVMLFFIVAFGFLAHFKTPKDKRGNQFWLSFLFVSIMGNLWNLYAVTVDPAMTAWIYVPGTWSGLEMYMVLEDLLFYFAFAFFFYKFYYYFLSHYGNKDFSLKTSNILKEIHFYSLIVLTTFFLFFTTYAGRSLALICAMPAILVFVPLWKYVNARQLTMFVIFGVCVEVAIDWLQVTVFSDFVKHWVGWAYIGFDGHGGYMQSKFFLDYGKYPWAWLWGFQRSPIEITPWFGISCTYFIYFSILGIKCLKRFIYSESLDDCKPDTSAALPLKSISKLTIACVAFLIIVALIRVYTLSKGAY
jgi:hypothetical protein